MASISSWSELPLDLLGLVVAHLPHPADRARSLAVCRSWHSAVRRHGHQLPWIIDPDGKVGTLSDGRSHHMSWVSDSTALVGSSDDWLILGFFHVSDSDYTFDSYLLHNEFSNASIPLPALEPILRGHHRIRKFRVRSTDDDLVIAALTTNEDYPLIVIRPGKGVWCPEPQAEPYINIVDIAFLGDTLYAVTRAEDLVPLCLTSDADGSPVVTIRRRVIRRSSDYHGYDRWPMSDGGDEEESADVDDDDVEEEEEAASVDYDDDVDTTDDDEEEEVDSVDNDNDSEQEEEGAAALSDGDDDYDDEDEEDDEEPAAAEDGNDMENNTNYLHSYEYTSNDEITYWHLVESRGKILMVRPHMRSPSDESISSICSVDVFEADMDTHAWVPMANGLGGGRALFVGLNFSKFVCAPFGEVKEDTIYFIESGDVFNVKNQTCNLQRFCDRFCWGCFPNLLFPPELVL